MIQYYRDYQNSPEYKDREEWWINRTNNSNNMMKKDKGTGNNTDSN